MHISLVALVSRTTLCFASTPSYHIRSSCREQHQPVESAAKLVEFDCTIGFDLNPEKSRDAPYLWSHCKVSWRVGTDSRSSQSAQPVVISCDALAALLLDGIKGRWGKAFGFPPHLLKYAGLCQSPRCALCTRSTHEQDKNGPLRCWRHPASCTVYLQWEAVAASGVWLHPATDALQHTTDA